MSELKKGYTTGTCAAASAKAGAIMLLSGRKIEAVNVVLPNNKNLKLNIENIEISDNYVVSAVKKNSGDDPDITNGIYIYTRVSKSKSGINITGGEGIGIVTKAGLNQPIGEYAINSEPRKSIIQNVNEVCIECEYNGGINIEIYAPMGVELAKKTFNPRLGIQGGISILGTTGIVEPMSEKALVDTISVELNVVKQKYDYVVGVFGNYGEKFAVNNLNINKEQIVTMSNFVGDTVKIAKEKGFKGILLVGHIGKMVKLSGGITNTHSKFGDCRIELLLSCAVRANVKYEILCDILKCNTTDEVVDLLTKNGIIKLVMDNLIERINYYNSFIADDMDIDTVVFSNKYGVLCNSKIDFKRYR